MQRAPRAAARVSSIRVERSPFPAGFSGEWHDRAEAQLIYPGRGVMILQTPLGQWVVPPQQACWLPSGFPHRVETCSGFEMFSVYCNGAVLQRLPTDAGVVMVSGLLRQIVLALETADTPNRRLHLAALFADEVKLDRAPRLFVPSLKSRRLKRIEAALADNPGDKRTLAQWADELAASSRTLARAFAREAGMNFTAYRRQLRLRAAMIRLAEGEALTPVAHDLAFGSVSNFIRAFRQATGLPPMRYFARARRSPAEKSHEP